MNYPSLDASPSWGEGGREAQGIAHDDNYWYITATEKFYLGNILNSIVNFVKNYLSPFGLVLGDLDDYQNCYLWKIPVGEPLDQDFTNNPKVKQAMLLEFPELSNAKTFEGYVHWGDVDYYLHRNLDRKSSTGYLVVPSTSNSSNPKHFPTPALIIFRADDLSLVGFGKLPGDPPHNHYQTNVGWCAVDSAGFVFTSNDDPDDTLKKSITIIGTSLFKYKVDWDSIEEGHDNGDISKFIHFEESHTLRGSLEKYPDGTKSTLLPLHNMQGGQFSPSNELLYISNGTGKCHGLPTSSSGYHPTISIHLK